MEIRDKFKIYNLRSKDRNSREIVFLYDRVIFPLLQKEVAFYIDQKGCIFAKYGRFEDDENKIYEKVRDDGGVLITLTEFQIIDAGYKRYTLTVPCYDVIINININKGKVDIINKVTLFRSYYTKSERFHAALRDKRNRVLKLDDYCSAIYRVQPDFKEKIHKQTFNLNSGGSIMRYFESMFNLYKETEELFQTNKNKEHKIVNKKINPVFGDVYFLSRENIYYIFVEKFDNLFRVVKMSPFWVLANQYDMIVEFDDDKWAAEHWNEFYLELNEFTESTYLGKLSNDDMDILKKVIYENEPIPDNKRGLEVPLGDMRFFQNKFHREESKKVFKYKVRIFK